MFSVNFYFIIVADLKPQQSYSACRQDNNRHFESLTALALEHFESEINEC